MQYWSDFIATFQGEMYKRVDIVDITYKFKTVNFCSFTPAGPYLSMCISHESNTLKVA